jgi:hypothetical protein
MIGAILARRQARAQFARLNADDLEGFMTGFADDAVFNSPVRRTQRSMSGRPPRAFFGPYRRPP